MEKQVPEIFDSEYQLLSLIWNESPVRMRDLVREANEVYGWQRTTVYTMVKRLSERGVLDFNDSMVAPLFTREQVQLAKAKDFVDFIFGGSLADVVEVYAAKKKMKKDDAARIREIMKNYSK